MPSYALLDQAEEDALHRSRLLANEERPFKRITKRLLAAGSPLTTSPQRLPTPTPDVSAADDVAAAAEALDRKRVEENRQFREDVLLDFAAFENSIVRIQLILTSNAKERERYAAEKLRIQATAQEVRDNTTELRAQLEEAQKTLTLRKTYDELAEKITGNRLLRPREDQHANLEKLNNEIAELEQESRDYAATWAERRQQFGRIIEEGMQLRRLIRDEKEEVERREGMEEREDGEEAEAGSARGRVSGVGTPRQDAGDGATPLHPGADGESQTHDRLLHPHARTPLLGSPGPEVEGTERLEAEGAEDVAMAEDGEVSVDGAVATPQEGLGRERDSGGEDEGNEIDAGGEKMDVS